MVVVAGWWGWGKLGASGNLAELGKNKSYFIVSELEIYTIRTSAVMPLYLKICVITGVPVSCRSETESKSLHTGSGYRIWNATQLS